jgi:predicted RNase H-like nuclease
MDDHHYKHREDLIDACLAAWTAALWVTAGPDRVQILGADDALVDERAQQGIVALAGQRATIGAAQQVQRSRCR